MEQTIINPISELKRRQGLKSLRAFAKEIPCSPGYLSDIYSHKREPGPLLLKFLGLKRSVTQSVMFKYEREA